MVDALLQHGPRRRFLVIFLALSLAGIGFWSFLQLKIEAYPDISDLQVTVITLRPGHAPEEVEQQVTVPIERALNSVPGVISRRSRTIFGLSVVDLTFDYEVDENVARQMVLERLRAADLPDDAEPSLAPPTTPAGELYRYVLEGEGKDQIQLRELQDWVVAPRILQAPGVGDVFPFGGLVKQYQIAVDPMALYKYGLSIQQIAESISANNANSGGALLPSGQQSLVVRGVGLLRSVEDIENVVVASKKGTPVFMRDIGKVSLGHAPATGIFGLDSQSGKVEGVVVMRRGENASEVLKGVVVAVADLNNSPLMQGVRLVPIYDRTELVGRTLHTVSKTLIEAFIIVLLILVFFLGSVRGALLAAITIPLSLLFAFFCMHLMDMHASLLSMGAIDFGIIVDGTLVMVECIVRRLSEEHPSSDSAGVLGIIARAAGRVRKPIFFSMLILIAAYIPLFTLERVERRLFMPMAFTIASALLGSLIFSLTLVPVLATYIFPKGVRPWRNPLVVWLRGAYEKALKILLQHKVKVVMATAAVVIAGLALGSRLGAEFLPQLDEGVIWIRASLPPGVSLETSAEVASRIRALVKEMPEARFVTSQTGRQESNTEPFGPNRNELLAGLTPYSSWPAGRTKAQVVRDMSERLQSSIPGVTFSFTQPIIDMVMESVTGSSADLAVILAGPDLRVLREKAGEVLGFLREVPGAADTAIEQEADQPQVRIEIDRLMAARYGINVSDVQDVIEMAIGGKSVSSMFEGDRKFDIVVRYVPEARSTLAGVGSLLVPAADGSRIPLSQLAKVRVAEGASIIARRDNRRQISVRTNIRGRDQGSFAREAQALMKAKVQLPPGYSVEWGGQFENLNRASRRLKWILPLTVGIIFTILYWAFGSFRLAGLVLACVPFSIVGGLAALQWRNIPFSVSAAVGFVSLFGVAVMSGVLYVEEMQRHRKEKGHTVEEAALAGAVVQFRALLTLIVVALLGMMPAGIAHDIGSDVQRPLATVVLGGLVSTMLLTLLALPCLYCLVNRPHGSILGRR
jgi:cobalt-zinc-cadmium resistance protein CzcA